MWETICILNIDCRNIWKFNTFSTKDMEVEVSIMGYILGICVTGKPIHFPQHYRIYLYIEDDSSCDAFLPVMF